MSVMRTRRGIQAAACAGMAVISGFVVSRAVAQSTIPHFWCEAGTLGPRGTAVNDSRFSWIARCDLAYVDGNVVVPHIYSGTEAADYVCDRILERGFGTGEVAIMLARFGSANPNHSHEMNVVHLMWNEYDFLASSTSYASYLSPWKSHGIYKSAAWMDEFLNEYVARQEAQTKNHEQEIPNPSRFIFDTEGWDFEIGANAHWAAMQADIRWSTAIIPGNASGGSEQTLQQLYNAAGQPACHAEDFYGSSNLAFRKFWRQVILQANSGAFKLGVFDRIHEVFPDARCSDFHQWSADGVTNAGTPPFIARNWTSMDPFDPNRDGERLPATTFSDQHAPSLYGPYFGWCMGGSGDHECQWNMADAPNAHSQILRTDRCILESIMHSSGGISGADMQPFVDLQNGSTNISNVHDRKELARQLLALCRAKGIQDFELFSPDYSGVFASPYDNTVHWNRYVDCVDQVWGATLSSRTLQAGYTTGGLEALRYSDWNREFLIGFGTLQETAVFDTSFGFGTPTKLRVNLETTPDLFGTDVSVTVSIRDFSNPSVETWTLLTANAAPTYPDTVDPSNAPRLIRSYDISPPTMPLASRYLDSSNKVYVRMTYQSAVPNAVFFPQADLIQVIALDPCIADINRDGVVDMDDLNLFLNNFPSTCSPLDRCLADVNEDRVVNLDDLNIFLNAWFGGCD